MKLTRYIGSGLLVVGGFTFLLGLSGQFNTHSIIDALVGVSLGLASLALTSTAITTAIGVSAVFVSVLTLSIAIIGFTYAILSLLYGEKIDEATNNFGRKLLYGY